MIVIYTLERHRLSSWLMLKSKRHSSFGVMPKLGRPLDVCFESTQRGWGRWSPVAPTTDLRSVWLSLWKYVSSSSPAVPPSCVSPKVIVPYANLLWKYPLRPSLFLGISPSSWEDWSTSLPWKDVFCSILLGTGSSFHNSYCRSNQTIIDWKKTNNNNAFRISVTGFLTGLTILAWTPTGQGTLLKACCLLEGLTWGSGDTGKVSDLTFRECCEVWVSRRQCPRLVFFRVVADLVAFF